MVFFWRFRQVSGIARESWRFLYRATLEPRHWHVLEQDREMLTNIPTDAHKREMLYQHDVGVARMRRMLTQQVKQPARGRGRRPRCEPRSERRRSMLAGRTIVVTGAARGVGRAIARACAKAGARLVLGDVLVEAGREVAEELVEDGATARFVPIDLNDPPIDRGVRARRRAARGRRSTAWSTMRRSPPMSAASRSTRSISSSGTSVMRVNVRGTWLVTRALGAADRRRRATAASSISPPTPRCGARRGSSPTWRARAR